MRIESGAIRNVFIQALILGAVFVFAFPSKLILT